VQSGTALTGTPDDTSPTENEDVMADTGIPQPVVSTGNGGIHCHRSILFLPVEIWEGGYPKNRQCGDSLAYNFG